MCMHMHARALLGAHACALAGWRMCGCACVRARIVYVCRPL